MATLSMKTQVTRTLTRKQQALLMQKLTSATLNPSSPPAAAKAVVPVVARNGIGLSTSFAQARIWFFERMNPKTPVYHMGGVLRFQGALKIELVEKAINEITRRHEVLRTTFFEENGELRQKIWPPNDASLRSVSLTNLPGQNRDPVFRELLAKEWSKPFDLGKGPLLRAAVVQSSTDHYFLILIIHHIIADGWSVEVFIREFAALFSAYNDGKISPLPPLPIQYGDFASWQNAQLAKGAFWDQSMFWQERLTGMEPLRLPFCRASHIQPSFAGNKVTFEIGADLTARLRDLARTEEVSLFMLTLAAFKALLFAYTGQDDITVGTPVANRNRKEFEGLIGLFVNSLALRTRLASCLSFRELFRRIQQNTIDALSNQDFPFEKVVEAIHPKRASSENPIFQVFFAFNVFSQRDFPLPGVTMSVVPGGSRVSKFHLEVTVTEDKQTLTSQFVYDLSLFDQRSIEQLGEHFSATLEAMVQDPDKQLRDFSPLTPSERNLVIDQWNTTCRNLPITQGIADMIEERARLCPDAIAIAAETQMSYSELLSRATALSYYLTRLGVGPDVLVGLYCPASATSIVGILGVLLTGGGYVPLDISEPPERLSGALATTALRFILTISARKERFLDTSQVIICLDDNWNEISTTPLCPRATPHAENLAYVIPTYASGGQVKACAITYAALASLLSWFVPDYGIEKDDGIVFIDPISFDFSQKLIFSALVTGARLIIPSQSGGESNTITEYLEHTRATILNSAPGMFHSLLETLAGRFASLEGVKLIMLSGEQVDFECLSEFVRSPHCHANIVNVYGMPECTDPVASYRFVRSDYAGPPTIPIGRPSPNVRLYILNSGYAPVPVEVVGELYVAGDQLGRGYFGCPGPTAESFIPNPYARNPGERFYRTGDFCRYLPDGNIDFVKCNELQVRFRGRRIDLGEIESVLKQHAGVRSAVAVVTGEYASRGGLTAYVVPEPKRHAGLTRLLGLLQRHPELDASTYQMHDGFECISSDKGIAEAAYRRIFAEQLFLPEEFILEPGHLVIDLSPNEGLFAVFLARRFEGLKILAFESAKTSQFCRWNCELCSSIRIVQPNDGVSGNSSATIDEILRRELGKHSRHNSVSILEYSEGHALTMLNSAQVPEISLLKLAYPKNWERFSTWLDRIPLSKVQQVAIEIAEPTDGVDQIENLLQAHGFAVLPRRYDKASSRSFTLVCASRWSSGDSAFIAHSDVNQYGSSESSRSAYIEELRKFLLQRLPQYLLPERFILRAFLPLDNRGAIDRTVLSSVQPSQPHARREPTRASGTREEATVIRVLKELLGVQDVRSSDNFFELGGHSLLANRLVWRLKDELGVELAIRRVFQKPEVHQIAEELRTLKLSERTETTGQPLTDVEVGEI